MKYLWLCILSTAVMVPVSVAQLAPYSGNRKVEDAKNVKLRGEDPPEDPEYQHYGIYAKTAPVAEPADARVTTLPLQLRPDSRIVFIGNTLFERSAEYGWFESMLHHRFPDHQLIFRNLAWSGDTPDLRPRPDNFASQLQHLTHERADVILAAYGFNESFAGPAGLPAFRASLAEHLRELTSRAFSGQGAPQVVLVSPIANEDTPQVAAGSRNNENLRLYTEAMRETAAEQGVAFADVFADSLRLFQESDEQLTVNGVHLNERGYEQFGRVLFRRLFAEDASAVSAELRSAVVDRNRQYFRRYRPLNTFYYTGGRSSTYGYLDFLPAMKNFDLMVAGRDQRIHDIAAGRPVPAEADDSQLPVLPEPKQNRGANEWKSAADELADFEVDPRFEVSLFAGEEQFPDIAAPIQIRWDAGGRLWVSTSTTYPHVYPGREPDDRLVVLEDTDGDGKADKSTVFADDLHIPLSFEFGNGGVYVSEQPNLTFLKDTDGDGRADVHEIVLSGFGTEDSHHSLHDFVWTPDGALMFRESIFHHSQVETPYGPVRQQNSGWFRFDPRSHRLTSFGTYHSTNPWGVTFDDWGQHMASHPIYAAAFHSTDPPYPEQHPRPTGLQAYSGTCGHEFVDFSSWPAELQGHFVKARYKPTNRLEILRWQRGPFGFTEEYVGDLLFSKNLSFIPVDLRYGPDGSMYVCDWYNPVKGHAQYSLRDERRDRHSGRIWRITPKQEQQQPADGPADESVNLPTALPDLLSAALTRPEYRLRYLAKRELRRQDPLRLKTQLGTRIAQLNPADPRYRRQQLEGLWLSRWVDDTLKSADPSAATVALLDELLGCEEPQARAAAVEQLRYLSELPDIHERLRRAAGDSDGIVRMQAAIACSWVGTSGAFEALLETLKHPVQGHTGYAVQCALNSASMRRHYSSYPDVNVSAILKRLSRSSEIREPKARGSDAQFDRSPGLRTLQISCVPERMLFSVNQFAVHPEQPVKVVFTNPDATDHNFVIVRPGALAEVGTAANQMARDPRNASSDFIPPDKSDLILHASPMIGPTRKSLVHVLRFEAPSEPGVYPFVCTFPGHWIVMNGVMVVARDLADADRMVAETQPAVVQEWTTADLSGLDFSQIAAAGQGDTADADALMRGMQAFVKARCGQCHILAGHGVNLGPDLKDVRRRFAGEQLLIQLLEPSKEIHKDYRTVQVLLKDGRVQSGVIAEETDAALKLLPNLLDPSQSVHVPLAEIEDRVLSRISAMPSGLLDVLTQTEIADLLTFLQADADKVPMHHHGR